MRSFQSFSSSSSSFTICFFTISFILFSGPSGMLNAYHHHQFYSHLWFVYSLSRFLFNHCNFTFSLVLFTPVSPSGISPIPVVFLIVSTCVSTEQPSMKVGWTF